MLKWARQLRGGRPGVMVHSDPVGCGAAAGPEPGCPAMRLRGAQVRSAQVRCPGEGSRMPIEGLECRGTGRLPR